MKLSTAFAAFILKNVFFVDRHSMVVAQQAGTLEKEGAPSISLKECTVQGGCTTRQAKLTLDANWRWIHSTSGYDNCYTGASWDSQYCSDPAQCAKNCAVEGVSSDKYKNTYGIEQITDGVKLNFVTEHEYGTNVGSRLYLLDSNDNYELFYLKNREFSLEIDVSKLECGMNGAMYFTEMDRQGDKGKGNNNAGSKYGTGYCDAQCPHDVKFISGEANTIDWKANPKDESGSMGTGKYGACCAEMDIWEANKMATAYTPHPCSIDGLHRCDGTDCGDNDKGERYDGVCDKDGCDMHPYRMLNKEFYGPGPNFEVDTTKPMTVVTQFLTDDGTDNGDLSEIRRFYIQDGKVIHSPESQNLGNDNSDSITDGFCDAKKELFEDVNDHKELGGLKAMGDSLDRGHVMIFSLWDDVEVNMNWLDSVFPTDESPEKPGVKRGECPGGMYSTPGYVRENFPDGYVSFKNAAVGEIGSIHGVFPPDQSNPTPPPTDAPVTSPTDAPVSSPTSPPNTCGCVALGKGKDKCSGNSKKKCKKLIKKGEKCSWEGDCAAEGCYSADYKNCLPKSLENDSKVCKKVWLKDGARKGCFALWTECTKDPWGCCEGAHCSGDGNLAVCVPNDASRKNLRA